MNVMQAVARILKLEGVDWVSCFPSNQLIEHVAQEGIRTIMFRQERGALMAADGYSRLNGRQKFGVTITQGGPGSENSMGGLAQAYSDNVPILYLPGGPALSPVLSKAQLLPSPHLRHRLQVRRGNNPAPARLPASCAAPFTPCATDAPARSSSRFPPTSATQEVPDAAMNYNPPKRMRQAPESGDVKEAVNLLLNARKPVIWSGMGVLMAGATEELQEFAELTEIPVYCTMPGKSSFDERHPLALGSGSSATSLPARTWLQESDVLFAVGSSMTRTSYGQPIPDGKVIIHNVESIDDINKDFSVDVGLPGDAKLTLKAMIAEVKSQAGDNGRKGTTDIADQIAQVRDTWMAEWEDILKTDETPISHYRVIGELERTLDKVEQHRNPRRRRTPRHHHALLHRHYPPQLHRLGQDHPPGLRHTPDDRRQVGPPRQVLPELHG